MMLRLIYKYCKRMEAISITPSEEHIFSLLLKFRQHQKLKTIIRVAGGWVRDKIMKKQSNDIDFALDDIDGETFTLLLKKYCEENELGQHISGFGVTKLNPQQSKNLRTATVKINNHFIDIVNLRSEKYSEDSRIPLIEVGTAKQDALRRDLTINALFYNIVTKQVEDLTGQGLDDIKNGIIRTPLDPFITFKDDPLRILRVFRFAGRYNYKVMPQILEAASRKDVQEFLKIKVSKQRIGIELTSMLKGANPELGLQYILRVGIWNIVFEIPENSSLTDQNLVAQIAEKSFELFKSLVRQLKQHPLVTLKQLNTNQDELKINISLCALTYVYEPYSVKSAKGVITPLIENIVKNSLKRSNSQALFPLRVNEGAAQILKLIHEDQIKNQIKFIKWLINVGDKWEISLLIAMIVEPKQTQYILKLKEEIFNRKWTQIYKTQSLVDGNFIMNELKKKGKSIGVILNNTLIWGIVNKEKTREDLIQELKTQIEKFQDPNMYA